MAASFLNNLFTSIRKKSSKKNRINRRVQLGIETLEDRVVPAGISVTEIGDVLRIDGTDADDNVEVLGLNKAGLQVKENDQTVALFKKAAFSRVEFYGYAGDDVFTTDSTIPTEAFGGEGNDYLIGGSAADWLDGGSSALDEAISLDGEYDFRPANGVAYNWGGKKDKWFLGDKKAFASSGSAKEEGWFFILPSGKIYEWDGSNKANGVLAGSVDVRYYEQPQRLVLAIESGMAYAFHLATNPYTDDAAIATDAEFGLHSNGNYWLDWAGKGEKWLQGSAGEWYYIVPTGDMYRSNGSSGDDELVRQLDVVYYEQPDLLHNAADHELARDYGFYTTGNYKRNHTGKKEKWLKGNGGQWFYIVPNGRVYRKNGDLIGTVDRSFYKQPRKLQAAAHSVFIGVGDRTDYYNQDVVDLDIQLQLESTGNYWFDYNGQQEKWLKGKDGNWYTVHPSGDVFRIDGDSETMVGSVEPEFYDHIYKLHNAADLQLIRTHGLYRTTNNYYDAFGQREKWVKGNGNEWFYLLPDGNVYHWNGAAASDDDWLGTIDETYYHDLAKLHAATDMSDNDIFGGGAGNDTIIGGPGYDQGSGNQGDDIMSLGSGYFWVTGNQGHDRVEFEVAGNVWLTPEDSRVGDQNNIVNRFTAEEMKVFGSSGDDNIRVHVPDYGNSPPVTIYGGAGNDTISGGSADDVIYGGAGDDSLFGGDGDDTIVGDAGNDFLNGQSGHDRLNGQAGNDTLWGMAGNDLLYGEAGNDRLEGHWGDDQLYGGAGADYLTAIDGYNVFFPNERGTDGARDIIEVYENDDERDIIFASRVDNDRITVKSGQLPEVQYAEDLPIGVKSVQFGTYYDGAILGGVGVAVGLVYDWSGPSVQVYDFVANSAIVGIKADVGAGAFFAYYFGGYNVVAGESWTVEVAAGYVSEGVIYDAFPTDAGANVIGQMFGAGVSLGLPASAAFLYTETTVGTTLW